MKYQNTQLFNNCNNHTVFHDNEMFEDSNYVLSSITKDIEQKEELNILITGANGMIVSQIIRAFLLYNCLSTEKKRIHLYLLIRSGIKKYGQNNYIHYITADVSELPAIDVEFDYIIHGASNAAPKIFTLKQIDTFSTNILGIYNLVRLSTKRTKGFLYLSTAEVYGPNLPKHAIKEDYIGELDHINPRYCYAEAKRAGESILMSYFRETGLPVKIARLFHTFGPNMNFSDGRVFSDFFSSALQEGHIDICGNPKLVRSYLYSADAAVMLIKFLFSDLKGEIFNIGSHKNVVSIFEFAESIQHAFHDLSKIDIDIQIHDADNNKYSGVSDYVVPDVSKFFSFFLFRPVITLNEATSKTVNYYLNSR